MLGMCYDSDFGLSINSSDEGEEVHAFSGQIVIQPEEVASLSRSVIPDQACS